MEHEGKLGLRLPLPLLDALEQERKRRSRAAGAEVKTSAVVRAVLERALTPRRSRKAARPSASAVR